ncbi:MAG TPA: flippase [Armatimonadota bacterium]|nr:flippase [Armatimonadota bacterium]
MTAVTQEAAPAAGDVATPRGEMVSRVAANSVWLICQPLLLNIVSVVSTGYIARKLGAADYGAFNLGFAQIALFSPLCNLGLRAVAVRAIAEDRSHAREIVGATFSVRLLFTAIAALLALLWLSLPTYGWTTRLIGMAAICSMVFQSLGLVAVDLFQGFERSRLAAQPLMIGGLILTGLSVLALLAGLGLAGFVGAYVLGAAIQTGMLHWTASRHLHPVLPRPDWPRARDLLRQARPFAVMSLLSSFTDTPLIDVLILGALYPPAAVGAYSAANGLVGRLLMIPHGVADALYPAVAHQHGRDRAEVETAVRRYVLNLALVTLPVALWLTFAAPTVLWILFGNQYAAAEGALRMAGWILPLTGLAYMIRECLSAVRRQGLVARLAVLSGVLLVAIYAALIPPFGLLGAAAGGVVRELIMLPIWLFVLGRSFARPVPVRELKRLAAALAVMAIPLAPLALHYSHLYAVVGSTLAFTCYVGAVLSLGLADLKRLPLIGGLRMRSAG